MHTTVGDGEVFHSASLKYLVEEGVAYKGHAERGPSSTYSFDSFPDEHTYWETFYLSLLWVRAPVLKFERGHLGWYVHIC